MGLTRTIDPVGLPVSLIDAKKQCEIGDNDTSHDDHLFRLIKAAVNDVERVTRRALITQTWRLSISDFPSSRRVYLPRPPLQEVVSVEYVDAFGAVQELSGSTYQVSVDAKPGFIEPAYGEVWPVFRTETIEPIVITYLAGYGSNSSSIPSEFQNVIFELVAFRFMNRGDVDSQIPRHIRWALDSLRCGAKYDYYGVKG